jgi:hypothetical protein
MLGESASILRNRLHCQAALGSQWTQKGRPMATFWMTPSDFHAQHLPVRPIAPYRFP